MLFWERHIPANTDLTSVINTSNESLEKLRTQNMIHKFFYGSLWDSFWNVMIVIRLKCQ